MAFDLGLGFIPEWSEIGDPDESDWFSDNDRTLDNGGQEMI